MRHAWLLTILISFVVLITGCAAPVEEAGSSSGGPGDPVTGAEIFESGGASQIPCASCHTLDGRELVGPTMQNIAARAGSRVNDKPAEAYLEESIIKPSAYVVDGFSDTMSKNYGSQLSQQEINDLVAYLLTLE